MICLCGANFCYGCGARLALCTCNIVVVEVPNGPAPRHPLPMVGEDLPVNSLPPTRADRVADTNPWLAFYPRQRARSLQAITRDRLSQNQCDHTRFHNVQGRHRCEACHATMREFIYECRQCQLRLLVLPCLPKSWSGCSPEISRPQNS